VLLHCVCLQDTSDVPALALANDAGMSQVQIKESALIYKKESIRPLTEYQKSINNAAQEICLKNPMYIYLKSHQRLLDVARNMVDRIYSFKKGRSRSKKYCTNQPVSKRPKLSFDARVERMKALEEEIKNVKDQISYKEKRHLIAET